MIGEEGELVVYRSEDGRTHVQLRAVEGTIWLTQAQIAELYDTSVSNIAHIMRRVLDDGEVTQATIDSELMVASHHDITSYGSQRARPRRPRQIRGGGPVVWIPDGCGSSAVM